MTETQLGGNAASAITPGRLVLLRHGQTVWSESGQHTGRTNIPLTDIGCDQARAAGERLREAFPQGFAQGCMFASPLRRAQQKLRRAHVRRSPRSNRCSTLETMCCWWRMRTFFVS